MCSEGGLDLDHPLMRTPCKYAGVGIDPDADSDSDPEGQKDPEKATTNLRVHGLSFEEASTVFADPLAMLMADPDHSVDEVRYVLLALSTRLNLLVVAFAGRPPRTRLISARQATRHERRQYEEGEG